MIYQKVKSFGNVGLQYYQHIHLLEKINLMIQSNWLKYF